MDPEFSDRPPSLTDDEAESLLSVARSSIVYGLERGTPLDIAADRFSPALRRRGASFVTLRLHGDLRGCIGSHEPRMPLVEDVSRNAFSAAFRDPRFSPMHSGELEDLQVHVSLLGLPQALHVTDEEDLVARLRPRVDGLLLEQPPFRALFLPQVWDAIGDAREFVRELKVKAGLPSRYWSSRLRFRRFTVEHIPRT